MEDSVVTTEVEASGAEDNGEEEGAEEVGEEANTRNETSELSDAYAALTAGR